MKTLLSVFFLAVGVYAASIPDPHINPDSIQSSDEIEDINNETRAAVLDDASVQRCIHDPVALSKARNAGLVLLQCISRGSHRIHDFFGQMGNHTHLDHGVTAEFCREAVNHIENCSKELEDSLRPCLSESDMAAVVLYNKLPQTAYSHLCSNNGSYIAGINLDQNTTCLDVQISNLDPCGIPLLEEARRLDRTLLSLPRLIHSQKGCRLFHEGVTCVRRAFSECEETDMKSLFLSAINATVNVFTNCTETPSV